MFPLRENRRTYLFYTLLLTFLALAAFGGLSQQLFDSDDFELLADASAASQDLSLFFSADRELPGRPVTELLFVGAYALWGDDPAGYHMLLVGLHLIASLLLAFTCRRLGADLELSLLAGLLFLVDVAHFRAVQWVACLAYPLALIFGLATLLCFAHYLKSGRHGYLIAAALLQGLAVSAHAASLFVALFCVYLGWSRGRSGRRLALSAAPLLATAALGAGLLHVLYPHTPQSRETFSALGGMQILGNLLEYMGRTLIQAHWLFAHGPKIQWAAGLLVGCGLVALLVRRVSPATDWAVWSLLALLPFVTRDIHDPSRYLYLASAGTALLWAWCLRFLATRLEAWMAPRVRQAACAAVLTALIAASLFSLRRAESLAFYYSGRAYGARSEQETSFELFNRAIARAPQLIPRDGYLRLVTDGFLVGASPRTILKKGLAQYPGDPALSMFLNISAFLHDDPQHHRQADQGIRIALSVAQDSAQLRQLGSIAFQHLGLFHNKKGRPGLAVAAFDRALSLRPSYVLALCGRAQALQAQEKFQEAIATYRAAVQLRPDLAAAHYQLGILLLEQGDRSSAVAALEKAVELVPGSSQTWYVLSQIHRLAGDLDAAHQAIRSALAGDAVQQRYWTEYCDVGTSYQARGATDQALTIYREVTRALPDYAGAHFNLGLLHLSQGRFAEAVTALQRVVQLFPDDTEARLALEQATRQMVEKSVTAQRDNRLLATAF